MGACAVLADLDHVDREGETNGALPAGDDDDDASKGGSSSSSGGQASTSGAATSSSGASGASGTSGTSGTSGAVEAGVDSGPTKPPVPAHCASKEECPKDDGDHDSCTNKGECKAFCIPKFTPCLQNIGDSCCVNLTCKDNGLGGTSCL